MKATLVIEWGEFLKAEEHQELLHGMERCGWEESTLIQSAWHGNFEQDLSEDEAVKVTKESLRYALANVGPHSCEVTVIVNGYPARSWAENHNPHLYNRQKFAVTG